MQEDKGGQNPPNTSENRPPPPGGSAGKYVKAQAPAPPPKKQKQPSGRKRQERTRLVLDIATRLYVAFLQSPNIAAKADGDNGRIFVRVAKAMLDEAEK